MNREAERMAYDAGRALVRVDWPDDASERAREVGEHHCPFEAGDPQRDAWLRGLRDGLTDGIDAEGRRRLLKRLDDHLEDGSDA